MGWEVHSPGLGGLLRRLATTGKPLFVTENGHEILTALGPPGYVPTAKPVAAARRRHR